MVEENVPTIARIPIPAIENSYRSSAIPNAIKLAAGNTTPAHITNVNRFKTERGSDLTSPAGALSACSGGFSN